MRKRFAAVIQSRLWPLQDCIRLSKRLVFWPWWSLKYTVFSNVCWLALIKLCNLIEFKKRIDSLFARKHMLVNKYERSSKQMRCRGAVPIVIIAKGLLWVPKNIFLFSSFSCKLNDMHRLCLYSAFFCRNVMSTPAGGDTGRVLPCLDREVDRLFCTD